MKRWIVWLRFSLVAALALCALAVPPCPARGTEPPEGAPPDTVSSAAPRILVNFEAGESAPRRTYGSVHAGAVEGTEGGCYFRFLYSRENTANLRAHTRPHSGYLVDTASVRVHANSILAFRYRSDHLSDIELVLKLTNQMLHWNLSLPESPEWTEMSVPLMGKFTRPLEEASTLSVHMATFGRLPEDRESVFIDLDEFRLESADPLSPDEGQQLEEGLRKRVEDEEALRQYLRVRNLRTPKRTYLQGESIPLSYEIANTSDRRLTVPPDPLSPRASYPIGSVQRLIEPLDEGARTTDFGRGRRGPRFADGGESVGVGKDHLLPGEARRVKRSLERNLNPGTYRYCVQLRAHRGPLLNEEHVEFTVLPPGSWTRIWGAVGAVVVDARGAIFATADDSAGDLHKLVGMPAQWEPVSAPGRVLALGPPTDDLGQNLYALSHDGSGIWRMNRHEASVAPSLTAAGSASPWHQKGWTKVGGPAKQIYGGGAGLFATSPRTGDIYEYHQQTGAWQWVGGPGKMFAVGAGDLYGLAPDGSEVDQYTGTPMRWNKIGGPARSIHAGGDKLFATSPGTGDVYEYTGSPMKWRKVGGPCRMLTVDNMGNLYRVFGDDSRIYWYTGKPMEWEWIGGPVGRLCGAYASPAGDHHWLLATNAETDDLWLYEYREDSPPSGPPSADEGGSAWHEDRSADDAAPPANARAETPLEAEALPVEVEDPSTCYIRIQQMHRWGPHLWSGGAQVFCGSQRGGAVTLRFSVEEGGDYHLAFYATKAPDYGIARISLDGDAIGGLFDSYAAAVIPSGRVPLGTVSLVPGDHRLRFEIVDRNDRATRFYFGIDCIELRRVSE